MNSVFEADFSAILQAVDSRRIQTLTEELLKIQGECDAPGILASAQWCKRELVSAGAKNIEYIEVPGDGKSAFNDCIIPKIWESTGRSVLEVAGGEVLADSRIEPRAIPPWSAPTPEGGITAPVSLLPEKGCWYLSPKLSPDVLKAAASCGCAGVILNTITTPVPPGTIRWENGSGLAGWYPAEGDPEITLFAIPPEKGKFLVSRLKAGEKVLLHGEVHRINKPGVWPTVTGVIPGEEEKEILFCAHLYEPFAADNAVSTPILLELCRILRNFPAKRRYTFRFWFGMERYGMAHYVSDAERNRKVLCLLNADCIANLKTESPMRFSFFGSAPASPFFADGFFGGKAQKLFAPDKVQCCYGGLTGDTFVSDQEPGIPSMLLESCDCNYWHLSCPQFNDADWRLAPRAAAFYGGCGLWLARKENEERSGVVAALVPRESNWEPESPLDRELLRRELCHRHDQLLASANPFEAGRGAKTEKILPLPAGASLIPEKEADAVIRRSRPIPLLSLAQFPRVERTNPPLPEFRLYWSLMDGKRSLRQIFLAAKELNGTLLNRKEREDFYRYLHFLERKGICFFC